MITVILMVFDYVIQIDDIYYYKIESKRDQLAPFCLKKTNLF